MKDRRESSSLLAECQIKKAQEIMERNHHLVTIIIIMNSDKSHEKMLKLLDESRMRNGMII